LYQLKIAAWGLGRFSGLVLSRAIVEAHGGSLWAEVGDHGIFQFVIPLVELGEKGEK
jgi:signal transduction histidine kinase